MIKGEVFSSLKESTSMKRPSFQFYPGDYRANTKLRRCSWAAKGVWFDIICLFHDSDEYGILRWSTEEIALAIGCSIELILELVNKGVLKGSDNKKEKVSFSTSLSQKNSPPISVKLISDQDTPLWYSSRMVRDEYIRGKRASNGFKSENNPNVPRKKGIEKDTFSPSTQDTFSPSPSYSIFNIPLKEKKEEKVKKEKRKESSFDLTNLELPDWLPDETWKTWVDHRKSIKKPLTLHASKLGISKLERYKQQGFDPIDILETSIANGYQGFFNTTGNKSNQIHNFKESKYEQRRKTVEALFTPISDPGTQGNTYDGIFSPTTED